MIHYKDALPPEKWPVAEDFLKSLEYYSKKAKREGKQLNVKRFIREYASLNSDRHIKKGSV